MRRPRIPALRQEVVWCLVGVLVVQLALGVCVDQLWPAIRDPEFQGLAELLRCRRSEQTERPFVLVLGSSRTQMALDAEQLSSSDVLVFNFGIPGGGPMMQTIALRRLLAEGLRPDGLVLEVLPMSFARRGGQPLEQRQLDPSRLTLKEVLFLRRYYDSCDHLARHWLAARILPCYRHQAELRGAIALDGPAEGPESINDRLHVNGFGFRRYAKPVTPESRAVDLPNALGQYQEVFADSALADRPIKALRHLLAFCTQQQIPTALVLPPESSHFRNASGSNWLPIDRKLRELADAFQLPLHDARNWIEDDGFWDGHHAWAPGAKQYTQLFLARILEPLLAQPRLGSYAARADTQPPAP
jgi:hypothetical protein